MPQNTKYISEWQRKNYKRYVFQFKYGSEEYQILEDKLKDVKITEYIRSLILGRE